MEVQKQGQATLTAPIGNTHTAILPNEILSKISAQIDRHSATQLARASKVLRDHGEAVIWREVDLNPIRPLDPVSPHYAPSIANRHIHIIRIDLFTSALSSHPFRTECITSLLLPPIPKERLSAVLRLLDEVQPRLQTLGLSIPQAWNGTCIPGSPELDHVSSAFDRWPRLRCLRMHGGADADIPRLFKFLAKCPRLDSVELFWDEPLLDDQWDPTDAVPLPQIKHLRFGDNMEARLCLAMVKSAENAESVTMLGWNTAREDMVSGRLRDLFPNLRQLEKLQAVYWLNWDCDDGIMSHVNGMARVKTLATAVVPRDEPRELDLGDMLEFLHALAHIENLIISTGTRLTDEEYLGLGVDKIPVTSRKSLHLPRRYLDRLSECPQLRSIQFVPSLASLSKQHSPARSKMGYPGILKAFHDTLAPSQSWEKTGGRGMVIRTYLARHPTTRTIVTETTETEPVTDDTVEDANHVHEVTHIRVLTRAKYRSNDFTVGARRAWHEFTRYRDRFVPYKVISKVYDLANISPDWTSGERNLDLPDVAWKVLDYWYDFGALDEDDEDGEATQAVLWDEGFNDIRGERGPWDHTDMGYDDEYDEYGDGYDDDDDMDEMDHMDNMAMDEMDEVDEMDGMDGMDDPWDDPGYYDDGDDEDVNWDEGLGYAAYPDDEFEYEPGDDPLYDDPAQHEW